LGRKPIWGFAHARTRLTTFNEADIYLDAAIRLHVFEPFFGDQFGRDLAYHGRLVTARKIDPPLAGELLWDLCTARCSQKKRRQIHHQVLDQPIVIESNLGR
jgi:hypothetical protein